ncbi:hypothetical protein V6C53_05960 [Desulfocurvibacter africanus]|uniref:DUF2802 domain-containing protein n=2 Tax=Desulfocurvibacter africanus TaxID=873 RepID=F3YTV6_DESAF|nr:hypothetical protein [Desulfocurvibacter africanus]EGJ48487.1 hypothetical protein Desaf_0127 [Desulfocurvibacter africanus subsp. africanus str. Walvis Bay]EMG37837.1 hypothetical protein PCS_01230 [Desulfocurvibacter africanus PCS]
MSLSNWLLLALSVTEVMLLGVVIFFFMRLKQSEAILSQLQSKQDDLLNKLRFNAQLEQELVSTFQHRQAELIDLDAKIEERAKDLRRIIKQAEQYSRSPQFLREVILTGWRSGKSASELARSTGLSVDEVELIIGQAKS